MLGRAGQALLNAVRACTRQAQVSLSRAHAALKACSQRYFAGEDPSTGGKEAQVQNDEQIHGTAH